MHARTHTCTYVCTYVRMSAKIILGRSQSGACRTQVWLGTMRRRTLIMTVGDVSVSGNAKTASELAWIRMWLKTVELEYLSKIRFREILCYNPHSIKNRLVRNLVFCILGLKENLEDHYPWNFSARLPRRPHQFAVLCQLQKFCDSNDFTRPSVCVYARARACARTRLYVCACVRVRMYACTDACMHVHTYACMHACMYACTS